MQDGPLRLSDLPEDVILMIYCLSSVYAIGSLRQTCRSLYCVSKDRVVWSSVLRALQQIQGFMPRPEKPLWRYSGAELEVMVIKAVRLEENWIGRTNGVVKPCRTRLLPDPAGNSAPGRALLVPGGRWLLFAPYRSGACITAYDLDTEEMEGQDLVDQDDVPVADRGLELVVYVSIVSNDPERFSFHLVVDFGELVSTAIWLVVLQDDGKNLAASHLKTLHLGRSNSNYRYLPGGCPVKDNLLCLCELPSDLGFRFEIYDWEASTLATHLKAVLVTELGGDFPVVHFLSSNTKMLVYLGSEVAIYNVPPFEAATPTASGYTVSTAAAPLWLMDLDRYPQPLEEPLMPTPVQYSPQSVFFILTHSRYGLKCVNLEDIDQGTGVTVEDEVPGTKRSVIHAGRHRALLRGRREEGSRWRCLTYQPPFSLPPLILSKCIPVQEEWVQSETSLWDGTVRDDSHVLLFDDETCRMVVASSTPGAPLTILDFV